MWNFRRNEIISSRQKDPIAKRPGQFDAVGDAWKPSDIRVLPVSRRNGFVGDNTTRAVRFLLRAATNGGEEP